jgi:hypothetical protein
VNFKVLTCWVFGHQPGLEFRVRSAVGATFWKCSHCERRYVTLKYGDCGMLKPGVTFRFDHKPKFKKGLEELYNIKL